MYTVKKSRDYSPLPGTGNGEFYGYAYNGANRCGTVWKLRDCELSFYVCNEDFDTRKHSRDNRPRQWKGRTLAELKANMNA